MSDYASSDGEGGQPALAIRHLTKTFGATPALSDVSFSVASGTIHGLLGGNGSGKSTLIKILAGVYNADHDGGAIELAGRRISVADTSPELARACGLRFVHQNPAVFPEMTVCENIAIGSGFPTRVGSVRWPELHRSTQKLLDRYEIKAHSGDKLGDLRQADQTMVAIARAMQHEGASQLSVLVLDEPTASLPLHEVRVLLDALKRMAESGQTILFVSHRLDEVRDLTDDVTILRDGRHVTTQHTKDVTEAALIEYIVGRPLARMFAEGNTADVASSPTVLAVRHLRGGPLDDVSLDVRAGEIVGVAGLLGSGRTELLQMIFGAYKRVAGTVSLEGRSVEIAKPADAIKNGVGYVPEGRDTDAVFPDMSVRENLSSGFVGQYWRQGRLRHRQEQCDATSAIAEFSIRTAGDSVLITTLSGGNAQKVVLARWLRRKPAVLLLDEPTQGVDVGARADVYAALRAAVSNGMGALLVSSDFDELAHASDRVCILRGGRIAGEVTGSELSRERLTDLVYRNDGEW